MIVDDTLDVCGTNPHNYIQSRGVVLRRLSQARGRCTRYFWQDHETDEELPRLARSALASEAQRCLAQPRARYLAQLAAAPAFPPSHDRWRDAVS